MLTEDEESLKERGSTLQKNKMLTEDEESLKKLDQKLLQSYLLRVPWRLKASVKNRLLLDIAVLCTGLRNVVMVDYAWDASGLQNPLLILLNLLAQDFKLIFHLGVMCIDDIVYIIHPNNLMRYVDATLKEIVNPDFIILDDILPRFAINIEKQEAVKHLAYFCEHLRSHMHSEDFYSVCMECDTQNSVATIESISTMDKSFEREKNKTHTSSLTVRLLGLGDILSCCELALPTINGWLLGYPAVYLVKKENISKAMQTLSAISLHRYTLLLQSEILAFPSVQGQQGKMHVATNEIMSFTVPGELNLHGEHEEWISRFFSLMKAKVSELLSKAIPLPLAHDDDPRIKELAKLEKEKAEIDKIAHQQVRNMLWGSLGAFAAQLALFFRLTFWDLSWDVMEHITFFVTSISLWVGFFFFVITNRDPSYRDFMCTLLSSKQKKLMRDKNFNLERLKEPQRLDMINNK